MWKKVNKSEPMKNSCSWLSNVWKSYVWHAVIRKSMSSNTRSWTFLNMKQKFIYRHWFRYLFSVNFTVFLSVNFSLPWIIRLRRNNPPIRHATERSEDWHLKRRVCRLGFHSISRLSKLEIVEWREEYSGRGLRFADGGGRNEPCVSCSPPQWGGGELRGSKNRRIHERQL